MKTLFYGNNPRVLEVLVKNSNVMGVVTKGDYYFDRNEILDIAKRNGIQLQCIEDVRSLKLDLAVSAGYHRLLPIDIIKIPKHGTINIHPSMLPRYRGQHVIQWQIINGEKEAGVTIHFMDGGFDSGDIITQEKIPILPDDNALTIWGKASGVSCKLLKNILVDIKNGKDIKHFKQDNSKATYFRKRTFEDGKIDFRKSDDEINNLVRALCLPWPGAFFECEGKKVIIDGIKIRRIE